MNPYSTSLTKTVSATEAKSRFGAVIDWATDNNEVLVESNGNPKVVIMSYSRYQEVSKAEDEQRRAQALETLRALRSQVQERKPKLTEDEAEKLSDRFVREVVEEMVKEGKIQYEQ